MRCPLGPSLTNEFLAHHERNFFQRCPLEYRSLYFRRVEDDIFVLFKSSDHLKPFQSYLNFETEQNNKISLFDVNVFR